MFERFRESCRWVPQKNAVNSVHAGSTLRVRGGETKQSGARLATPLETQRHVAPISKSAKRREMKRTGQTLRGVRVSSSTAKYRASAARDPAQETRVTEIPQPQNTGDFRS